MTLPPTPTLPKAEQSGYAPVNGVRIWYAEFGKGEPVILLHGGLGNSNYWATRSRRWPGITASSSWTAAAMAAARATTSPMATT
jgi:pimeloyl-ACP methyl ester carboxylesterase